MAAPLLQRFEIKYVIPESRVAEIRDFMTPYMRLDPFSARSKSTKYAISSLYLDTADRQLAGETKNGIKTRFKMRVRAYNDSPDTPIFCEVKHRDGDVISKTRVGIPRDSIQIVSSGRTVDASMEDKDRRSLADFQTRVHRWNFTPAMVVRYNREAFESSFGAPVRITFDRHLRRYPAQGWEVPVHNVSWTPVRWSPDPTSLVLEVKFTGQPPRWVRQMIRSLEVRQTGHGKYVASVDDANQAAATRLAVSKKDRPAPDAHAGTDMTEAG